ncbi:hypothetical protein TcWFU_010389 [Taenia crassiceps]|uniref:Uncharacterized protein n=1 Tax=Taenia crassiceps TaxID=6207 RepID=A0ABR4QNL8_9CEST
MPLNSEGTGQIDEEDHGLPSIPWLRNEQLGAPLTTTLRESRLQSGAHCKDSPLHIAQRIFTIHETKRIVITVHPPSTNLNRNPIQLAITSRTRISSSPLLSHLVGWYDVVPSPTDFYMITMKVREGNTAVDEPKQQQRDSYHERQV